MATTADIKNGIVINSEGNLLKVVEFQHIKLGRGGARVWTKFKNVKTGLVVENTYRSGEKIDIVRLESRDMQYLYRDGSNYILMDVETFEQYPFHEDLFEKAAKFIKENEIIHVLYHDETPVDVEIPLFVNLKVIGTEPGLKGDTVTGATKVATLETGAKVAVPLFLNEGDTIRIDTRTGGYVERVK
ncbi:MAG: elongation factor P [Candidatus Marinimicrobia bacterium CG08_land_8_20_14_0_20_45_22]|nr:MAG: elongation factor P [Candidatus Marinimicrobia bacterium CG08_land_8_20_14_0_20_45_22]